MTELTIHSELTNGAEIVTTVIGELDAASVPALVATIGAMPIRPDIIDCRFVSILTAAGVTALLDAHAHQPFRLVASTAVARLIELCELGAVLDIAAPTAPPCLRRAPFGMSLHGPDLRYLYVNDELGRINGLTPDEHVGRRPSELFDVHHDDVTPILERVIAERIEVRRTVLAATAANPDEELSFSCRYRFLQYPHPDASDGVVVATVEPSAAESTREASRLAGERPTARHDVAPATARLDFERRTAS